MTTEVMNAPVDEDVEDVNLDDVEDVNLDDVVDKMIAEDAKEFRVIAFLKPEQIQMLSKKWDVLAKAKAKTKLQTTITESYGSMEPYAKMILYTSMKIANDAILAENEEKWAKKILENIKAVDSQESKIRQYAVGQIMDTYEDMFKEDAYVPVDVMKAVRKKALANLSAADSNKMTTKLETVCKMFNISYSSLS